MTKEQISNNNIERAIFMIKPDGQKREVAGYPLPQLIIGLIESAGLLIRGQAERQLDENKIRLIYPILSRPSEYGEQWKLDVIHALQVLPLKAFLVEGEQAENKVKIIRSFLRETLTDRTTEGGRVVENIAHVSDTGDFEITYLVLFCP